MPRITKVYTRTGDDGTTALGGGQRVAKDALRIEAYGTVDELSSAIGVARAAALASDLDSTLARVQNELFHLGSDLCFVEADKVARPGPRIEERHVLALEAWLDEHTPKVGPLTNFILPGGSPGAAALHLARTICRRAERGVVALGAAEPINRLTIEYLNRLSDALFVMARSENQDKGVPDVTWDSRA